MGLNAFEVELTGARYEDSGSLLGLGVGCEIIEMIVMIVKVDNLVNESCWSLCFF
jgi:hypothetical protein